MHHDLLKQYNHELINLKQNLSRFADKHPHLAEFLSHNDGGIRDPMINQLLEGIAFLNSRIGIQLSDSLKVFSNALLQLLAPDFLAPFPAMSILQLTPQTALRETLALPAGLTLETDPTSGFNCYFKTCYSLELIPATVTDVCCQHDFSMINSHQYAANLTIKLQCLDNGQTFSNLKPKKLRFYLQGKRHIIEALYQHLLEDTQSITLTCLNEVNRHITLPTTVLKTVGFAPEELLLPGKSDHHLRLLAEYFYFNAKFWFIDIEINDPAIWQGMNNEILLSWHFNHALPVELLQLTADNFALNAVPIINLFSQTALAIQVDPLQFEYPILMDEQEKNQITIYQIDQVLATNQHDDTEIVPQWHSIEALQSDTDKRWWATRTINAIGQEQVNIAIIDEQGQSSTEKSCLTVSTLCCNGNLPNLLATENRLPALRFTKPPAAIAQYKLLTLPTKLQRLASQYEHQSTLLAQVLLKQMDLTDGNMIKQWLDLIFACYVPSSDKQGINLKKVIKKFSSRQVLGRLPQLTHNQLCYGSEFILELTDDWRKVPTYLFIKVLDECLVAYSALNSFNQLKVYDNSGVIKSWPRRSKTSSLR